MLHNRCFQATPACQAATYIKVPSLLSLFFFVFSLAGLTVTSLRPRPFLNTWVCFPPAHVALPRWQPWRSETAQHANHNVESHQFCRYTTGLSAWMSKLYVISNMQKAVITRSFRVYVLLSGHLPSAYQSLPSEISAQMAFPTGGHSLQSSGSMYPSIDHTESIANQFGVLNRDIGSQAFQSGASNGFTIQCGRFTAPVQRAPVDMPGSSFPLLSGHTIVAQADKVRHYLFEKTSVLAS